MNETDKQILEILLKDARTSHAQIAEEVGLSRPAVAERIKKMEQSGVIKGFSVVVGPTETGQKITAFISARTMGILSDIVRQALMDLQNAPEVLEIYSVAGEDCFLIKVRTSDMGSLNTIVNRFKEPPFEMVTKTTIVLERYFEKAGGITV